MMEVLACRGCRRPLSEDAGCALCLPVKPHLVVSSAVDEDAVPLATVAGEAVAMLRKQLTACKAAMKLSGPKVDPIVSNEVRQISSVLAKLLDSARKVIQDGADAVDAMSFQEKANLFLEWSGSLPGVYRRRLIEQMITQNTRSEAEPTDERAKPSIN